MFQPDFLKGKRALVTGSTSGIGLAIARALQEQGADIVLNGFGDADEIASLCEELGATHSGADLTDVSQIEKMMAEAGGIDILINNAGMQFVSPVEEFPVAKWDQIIALNLSAAFHTSRLAVPHMKERGWGRIINTASAHSLTASPFKSAYVAANQIPDTMKARNMTREQVMNDVLLAKQPTKQFVQPEEIGALAVFLCSDAGRNVNGANWSVDGGWTAE